MQENESSGFFKNCNHIESATFAMLNASEVAHTPDH